MKKLLCLVLAMMLAMTVIGALAEEEVIVNENGVVENPEAIVGGEHELMFWSLFSGGEGNVMVEFVDNYNATNPEYTVRNVQLDWGEYYTKLTTAVAVGKGPDIGISHLAKLPELYDLGVVTALDDAAAAIDFDWSQVNQNNLAACTIDGSKYAVPLDTHPNVLYYNKDLLKDFLNEDGTLTLPQVPKSSPPGWARFRNPCRKASMRSPSRPRATIPSVCGGACTSRMTARRSSPPI